MKKLFASIVAALALVPVVASAATYSKGDYINFAGNDTDWETLKSAGTAEAIESVLNGTGIGTLYVGETSHKDDKNNAYLKVISLFGIPGDATSIIAQSGDNMLASGAYIDAAAAIRTHVKSPYGYATTAANGVDVGIATLQDVKDAFGISDVGDITLTDSLKALFGLMTASATTNVSYVFTSTEGTGNNAGLYAVIKVTKSNDVVTKLELGYADASNPGGYSFILPVLEMNSAYVCGNGIEENYSCYECTKDDKTVEYVWALDGSQADTCKKSTKITSKAKCVKSPKTGVDSYLIPSAIVLGVCAIVLTVVKRKDAFKAI